jgi:hypothetical protein
MAAGANDSFGIKVFGRIKPLKKPYAGIEIAKEEHGQDTISFAVPRQEIDGLVNNKKELFMFKFQHIFPESTTQEEIFDVVARPTIDRFVK